jgi:hypothetical protein
MNMNCLSRSNAGLLIGLVLLWSGAAGTASPKDAPAKSGRKLVLQRVPEVPIPQSVFNIPSQPSEGRNPFYPQSVIKVVVPKINKDNNPLDTTTLVLNGITSPPRRTAMINGRTFEPGEEGEVRTLAGNRVLIKVEEIKTESAIIVVGGQRRELHLRAGV